MARLLGTEPSDRAQDEAERRYAAALDDEDAEEECEASMVDRFWSAVAKLEYRNGCFVEPKHEEE